MLARARSYLSSFRWCRAIRECYVGEIAVGAVVLVVLFRIEPTDEDVDEWLWVVVGDLPPAYLVTDQAPDAPAALARYAEEMDRWVSAVRAGEPADDLIPVQTAGGRHPLPATPEHAEDLARRLRTLRELFLDPGDARSVHP